MMNSLQTVLFLTCVFFGDAWGSVSDNDDKSLQKVLDNMDDRQSFKDFLIRDELNTVNALTLWENCDNLLKENERTNMKLKQIKKKCQIIFQWAVDNVEGPTQEDFQLILDIVSDTSRYNKCKILPRVVEWRQTAYNLMQDDYNLFKDEQIS